MKQVNQVGIVGLLSEVLAKDSEDTESNAKGVIDRHQSNTFLCALVHLTHVSTYMLCLRTAFVYTYRQSTCTLKYQVEQNSLLRRELINMPEAKTRKIKYVCKPKLCFNFDVIQNIVTLELIF